MIILRNTQRKLRTFEIPVSIGGGETHHVGATVRTKEGDVGLMVYRRQLPTTLTLCAAGTPGSESAPLAEAVLAAPQIAAALAASPPTLEVVPVPVPASSPSPTTAPLES